MSAHDFHEEEALGKAYDHRLMRRLLGFLRPHRKQATASLALVLVSAGLALAGPWLTKIAIDDFIANHDLRGLSFVGIAYILVMLIQSVVEYGQMSLMQTTGQEIMYDIRMLLFQKLQRLPLSYYDKTPVGRMMTRVTNDVDVLNELFTSGVVTIFGDVFTLLGILVVMVAMNWELAIVSFSVLPLIFIVTMIFRVKVRETYRDVRTRLARMNSYLNENLTGMSTVQIMNREER
ncbi:MAG TPA: ABC transporter ATP-binding protein, partial [Candidatus Eisenbacteria bacterium]|nr:ABC transporter ATP-binding protein [Candidatus Eisenbacteria bacterium]